jgi:hypothetical protein
MLPAVVNADGFLIGSGLAARRPAAARAAFFVLAAFVAFFFAAFLAARFGAAFFIGRFADLRALVFPTVAFFFAFFANLPPRRSRGLIRGARMQDLRRICYRRDNNVA